jgi:hypothetical protein
MPFSLKAFSAFSLSFEIEETEAPFSLPEPNRFIRNVGRRDILNEQSRTTPVKWNMLA